MAHKLSDPAQYDMGNLTQLADRTMSHAFYTKQAGFLGPVACSLNFIWNDEIGTACTDGVSIQWNPDHFLSLVPDARVTVFMHEIWHVADLHLVRRDHRDPLLWNLACDISINNRLENQGYSFQGIENCWKDQSYGELSPEEIYDLMVDNNVQPPPQGAFGGSDAEGDMGEPDDATIKEMMSNVMQAAEIARKMDKAGDIPGNVETILKKFLDPIIPWNTVLYRFFTNLGETDYSLQVRDRRFTNICLSGEIEDNERLQDLLYMVDVSGSVTDDQVIRCNSEIKYIKDTFNPQRLTLVQFDTRITSVKVFEEDDPFDEVIRVGNGGTSLVPVRDYIIENRPTAVVIFSDLECRPMKPLPFEVPTIWICVSNQHAEVAFGELIHIKA